MIDALAEEFSLTDDEQKQLLPSGQQRVFDNRIAWARVHMKMALLIENTRRGVFRITERGKEALRQSPSKINLRFLRQYPEYVEIRGRHQRNRKEQDSTETEEQEEHKTPEEQLEEAYEILRGNLI